MMLKINTIGQTNGQTAIELLIGLTILSMVFIGILTLTIRSLQLSEASANRQRAIFLAKEGLEKARRLRTSSSWSSFYSIANTSSTIDNSQFTRTCANTLTANPNQCIPIENIVIKVTKAVSETNKQSPKFGKISGMIDEDGTFFFIKK